MKLAVIIQAKKFVIIISLVALCIFTEICPQMPLYFCLTVFASCVNLQEL